MLMPDQESSELTEPRVGSLDDPAPLVSAQFPSVFVAPLLVVVPVRGDQLDASLLQSLAQRVRVVGTIGDHAFRFLPRAAFGPGDADFLERGFRKRSFSRRGTFKPNSQRKTLTVDQYHPLRSLAALGFTDGSAPFLAGAKLPSRKASSHRSNPSPSKAPSNVRQASSQTSCSSHCFKRRQQVAGEGYLSGRNRQAAPCPQHPENAFQAVPVRCPGPTAVIPAALGLRQQRLNQSPLRIRQQFKSTLAHTTSETNSDLLQKVLVLRPNLFMKQTLRIGMPRSIPYSLWCSLGLMALPTAGLIAAGA